MTATAHTLLIDTREPDPHPWLPYLPAGVTIERMALETGDIALAAFAASVVERKTVSDFLGVIGGNRERFEKELRRARCLDRFCIIVEGGLADVIGEARGIHLNAIIGTVAAWTRRYCPVLFADSAELAARLALCWLLQPVEEAGRAAGRIDAGKP